MDIIIIIIWVNYFRVVNLKSKLISIFLTVDSGVWCCILPVYPVRDLNIKLSSTFFFPLNSLSSLISIYLQARFLDKSTQASE